MVPFRNILGPLWKPVESNASEEHAMSTDSYVAVVLKGLGPDTVTILYFIQFCTKIIQLSLTALVNMFLSHLHYNYQELKQMGAQFQLLISHVCVYTYSVCACYHN